MVFSNLKLVAKGAVLSIFVMIIYSLVTTIPFRYFDYNTKAFNKYSKEYMFEVFSAINLLDNQMGVFWSDKEVYQTIPYTKKIFVRPAFFLCLNDPYSDLIDINNYYSLANKKNTFLDMQYLKTTPFVHYLSQKHLVSDSIELQERQYSFIKENSIGFGFANDLKNIPGNIKSEITYTLQDSATKEYFIKFNLTDKNSPSV